MPVPPPRKRGQIDSSDWRNVGPSLFFSSANNRKFSKGIAASTLTPRRLDWTGQRALLPPKWHQSPPFDRLSNPSKDSRPPCGLPIGCVCLLIWPVRFWSVTKLPGGAQVLERHPISFFGPFSRARCEYKTLLSHGESWACDFEPARSPPRTLHPWPSHGILRPWNIAFLEAPASKSPL